MLLKELTTRTVGGPGPGSGAPGASGSPPGAAPGGGGTGGGKAALEWLLEADPGTGFGAVTTAVAGMCWRDDSAHRFALLARSLVGMAPRDARLYAYVGSEVLKAAITSLGTEVRRLPPRRPCCSGGPAAQAAPVAEALGISGRPPCCAGPRFASTAEPLARRAHLYPPALVPTRPGAVQTMATHQADVMQLIRDILAQQINDPGWASRRLRLVRERRGSGLGALQRELQCRPWPRPASCPWPRPACHASCLSPAACLPACRSSAVHGVLASLPKMTPADLDRFRSSLLATGSEKAQRDLTKKMLVRRGLPCPWWPPSLVGLRGWW